MNDKVVDWVEKTRGLPENVILDERDGLHCSNCGKTGEEVPILFNNPEIPRVVCWECLSMELLQ